MSTVLRIALTGGIGSGKSTIATRFQELGVPIIDTDIISRDVVEPGQPCLNAIVNQFGSDFLNPDKTLNRDKLRNIIFDNDLKKRKLEKILHPAIYQKMENQVANVDYPYCLIVIPLLIETKAVDRFDKVLVVDTTEAIQIKRAGSRNKLSNGNIEKIIKNQATRKQRLKYADDIIDNSLTIEELNEAVQKLHEKYIKPGSLNIEKNE